jgi:hypothetical protein
MSVPSDCLRNYSPERPLLLLTDYPPDTGGGGAVILRDLLGPAERESVLWLSPSRPSAEIPNSHWLRSGSAGKRGRRSLGLDSTFYADALTREVEQVARDRNARAIWIVMHGAGVAIADKLSRKGGWPLHLTVHDDPAFANALRSKRYLLLVPLIERQFASALKWAKSVDVICEAMRQRYLSRYDVDSVIVHRGLTNPVEPSPEYHRRVLRVGVLGSTYSYEPLPVLGRAVAAAAERLGVPGEVVVMGRSHGEQLRDEMAGRIKVDVTGHVDEAAAVPMLQDCFALYLNYPFGRRDAVLRQTSFPTKLSTYIQAARPLIMNVPSDSSVIPLLEHGRYASLWDSPNEAKGTQVLVDLWNDPRSHQSWHGEAEAVRSRYYDRGTNRRILFQVLDGLVT